MVKIKLCECGAQPELKCESMIDIVICPGCGAEGPEFFDGMEWAIEAWNKGMRNNGDRVKAKALD